MTVIYVDVLLVVNFFITFLLLLITQKLAKENSKLVRLVLASFAGAAYSLVILFDELDFAVSLLGKLAAACLIVLIAFRRSGLKCFAKNTAIFFFVNFVFVGIMVGLWMIFKPAGIVINNSTVYFDVSATALLISAFIAYVISAVIIRIYNNKTAKNELYQLTVYYDGQKCSFFAFADSGNNLREPFSDYPVIVADENLFKDVPCSRVIPVSTVNGEGILKAFKPEKVVISTSRGSGELSRVYIALSKNVKKGEYQGIINPKSVSEVQYASKN
ncbi:MAG TPA: sigma-E processing peptidase SpoIIGA [Candidatus Eubacterium faecale]|uniref:Sporulation sigma-E factor-processing peptidase n=1 Tax=Candidatus Eubacterium faecale TaxID=2838568 RepID=A0A9D2MK13_9FIRM|nr:sigma-E processing peptidase SpoIIGA [Candidatus Eubacterium faecale]